MESTQLEVSTNMDKYCEGQGEDTLNEEDEAAVERIVAGHVDFSVYSETSNSQIQLPLDQDHIEMNNIMMLRLKVLALSMEISNKDVIIADKDSELLAKKIENENLVEEITKLKADLQDSNRVITAQKV